MTHDPSSDPRHSDVDPVDQTPDPQDHPGADDPGADDLDEPDVDADDPGADDLDDPDLDDLDDPDLDDPDEPDLDDPDLDDPDGDDPDGDGPGDTGQAAAGGPQRFGFVAIIGVPNAGKSTLLNTLVGARVAAVSRKVQTTRARLVGIAQHGQTQIAFVDTPGIFQPKKRLDRAMVHSAWEGAEQADVIALLVDAARSRAVEETLPLIERIRERPQPKVLLLNKVDLIAKERLLPLAAQLGDSTVFAHVFMISGLTGGGLDRLLDTLAQMLPVSPWHYAPDQIVDVPMRLLAAEITRERILEYLHQEVPYATTVTTEGWEERADGSVRIEQTIWVERDSQRAIVLGKGGQQIKRLGAESREALETLFETRVHLFLYVKVKEDWSERREFYSPWGLDYNV